MAIAIHIVTSWEVGAAPVLRISLERRYCGENMRDRSDTPIKLRHVINDTTSRVVQLC